MAKSHRIRVGGQSKRITKALHSINNTGQAVTSTFVSQYDADSIVYRPWSNKVTPILDALGLVYVVETKALYERIVVVDKEFIEGVLLRGGTKPRMSAAIAVDMPVGTGYDSDAEIAIAISKQEGLPLNVGVSIALSQTDGVSMKRFKRTYERAKELLH